jgi:hypothetical protein
MIGACRTQPLHLIVKTLTVRRYDAGGRRKRDAVVTVVQR